MEFSKGIVDSLYSGPRVNVLHLASGAAAAVGLAVIVDVFRAFSLTCYAFAGGAVRIIPVAEVAEAWKLKQSHPDYLLVGERGGMKIDGFDFGNSPAAIDRQDLTGKTIIHTTTNGTRGLHLARKAQEVVTGSFVNAGAVLRYIRTIQPSEISIVCMGAHGKPAEEDVLCARYLKRAIEGRPPDFETIRSRIQNSHRSAKFFDPGIRWAPEEDFHCCMALDKFNFILNVRRNPTHGMYLEKTDL